MKDTQENLKHETDKLQAELSHLDGALVGIEHILRVFNIPTIRSWPIWATLAIYELAIAMGCVLAIQLGHAIYVWPGSILAVVCIAVWFVRLIQEKVIVGYWKEIFNARYYCYEKLQAARAREMSESNSVEEV